MSPKIRYTLFSLFLIAAVALSACNNPTAAEPGRWYLPWTWGDRTAEQTANDLLTQAKAEKTVRDAQAAATAMANGEAAVFDGTPEAPNGATANTSCLAGYTIVSTSSDWTVVVVNSDGRIWQPCLPDGATRPAFSQTFTAPKSGKYTYNGVNSTLLHGDAVLADKVNGKTIELHEGWKYQIVAGQFNGGIELLPLP